MTNRERVRAILNDQNADRIPLVAFGYWEETLQKWAHQGHITQQQCDGYYDNSPADCEIMAKLGFDFNWSAVLGGNYSLYPAVEEKVLSVEPDGAEIIRDHNGLIVRRKADIVSIPSEIGTTLTDREAWEKYYLPKLQFCEERIPGIAAIEQRIANTPAGNPIGLHCGSLYGFVRDLMGVEQLSYIQVDDEDLYAEIIDTCADLCYRVVERILQTGVQLDYAHFWEDICFKNGPLVNPTVFAERVGPHYRRITELLKQHGVNIVSLDCDGKIDLLVPIWLKNGVNTMFPIEVGTWNGSIGPWREKYGRDIRGVGGMDKRVFAQDRAAVDREIERLKPLVDMGGYIPCPDHRIAPDAEFANVAYYCEQFRKTFG